MSVFRSIYILTTTDMPDKIHFPKQFVNICFCILKGTAAQLHMLFIFNLAVLPFQS